MPKVSVIIPIYGVEKYIERCAESLFQQTLDDIEYIFVDDCTPDNSIEILKRVIERYPHRKKQVRIERMPKNSGLPAVRTFGLQFVTSDYIVHCDSDDWVSLDIYEKLYDKIVKEHADLVFCDYYISEEDDKLQYFSKQINDTTKTVILSRLLTEFSLNPLWSVIAHKKLYNEIITPQGNQGEDNTFMIQLVYRANKICYLAEALYFYRITPNSISRSVDVLSVIKRYHQLHINRRIIRDFAIKYNFLDDYQFAFDAYFFRTKNILNDYIDDISCGDLWLSSYKLSLIKIILNKYISLKEILNYCRIKLLLNLRK